jgi:hypothetical protein
MSTQQDFQIVKPLLKSYSARKVGGLSKSRNSMSYSNRLPGKTALEQLNLEMLTVKTHFNEANEKISKLSAKVSKLKGDLDKANGVICELSGQLKSNSAQLAARFKRQVQQLKGEVDMQRAENAALKKKMRITQLIELETEKQMYISECTRLRRLLDNALGTRTSNSPLPGVLSHEAPKAELDSYKISPRDKMRRKPTASSVSPIRGDYEQASYQRPPRESGIEHTTLQETTSVSHDRSSERLSTMADLGSNRHISELQRQLKRARKDLETVLCAYGPQDWLSADDLYTQLHFSGVGISEKDVKDLWRAVFPTQRAKLTRILETLGRAEGSFISHSLFEASTQERLGNSGFSIALQSADVDNQTDTIMQHLALRMQLHRVTNEQAVQMLADVVNASPSAQQTMLLEEPFEFTDEDLRSQVLGLLSSNMTLHELSDHLGTWRVLEDSEEDKFDAALSLKIKNKAPFLSACKHYDRAQKGCISLTEFFAAGRSCGMDFEPRLKLYIKLLSYSFEHKLNSAPYISLVEAFTKEESIVVPEISGEEQEAVVSKVLKDIVISLKRTNSTLASVFKAKEGLLSPKGMLDGLNSLLSQRIQREDFLVLLATLQSENYEEPLVEFSHLASVIKAAEKALPPKPKYPEKLVSLLDSSLDLEEENESFIQTALEDPVKMSSRALYETQTFSIDSAPRSL